jgi:hypothetical protein
MPHYREMPHHRGLPHKKRKEPPKRSNVKLYVAAGVFVVLAFAGAIFIPSGRGRIPDRFEAQDPIEAGRKERRLIEKVRDDDVARATARGASRDEIEKLKASYQVQINKLPKD